MGQEVEPTPEPEAAPVEQVAALDRCACTRRGSDEDDGGGVGGGGGGGVGGGGDEDEAARDFRRSGARLWLRRDSHQEPGVRFLGSWR